MLRFPKLNPRILWGPNSLHQLSDFIATALFRRLGLSSWHSFDLAWITSKLPVFLFTVDFLTVLSVAFKLGCLKYR